MAGPNRVVRKRWIYFLSMSLMVAALWIVAERRLLRTRDNGSVEWKHDRQSVVVLIVLGLGIGLAKLLAGRPRAFLGDRHFFCCPPLWFALVTAFSWVYLANAAIDHGLSPSAELLRRCLEEVRLAWVASSFWLALPVGVLGLMAIVARLRKRRSVSRVVSRTQLEPHHAESSARTLGDWIAFDRPITDPADDRLRYDTVVAAIVRHLQVPGKPPGVALRGPLGSGKTSIVNLVRRQLENQTTVLSTLELWPFESPTAAARGILDHLIDDVRRRVDALTFSRLPREYAGAISAADQGFLSELLKLLSRDRAPDRIIKELDDVLDAIGIRVILWLEDLERFAHAQPAPTPEDRRGEEQRLHPVRALVHLLGNTRRITVCLSDGSARSTFDFAKIARFEEQVPPMSVETVTDILHKVEGELLDD